MAEVKLSPPPRRSCEESLAFRATVSPPHLRRKLPRPALAPTVGPSPAQLLREMMEYPFPEAVWQRIGQRALTDGEPHEIAEAIQQLGQRITDHQRGLAKLRKHLPLLYPKKVA